MGTRTRVSTWIATLDEFSDKKGTELCIFISLMMAKQVACGPEGGASFTAQALFYAVN